MNSTKLDMRDIISTGFDYGMVIHGALSVNGNDMALCQVDSSCMTILYNSKINGFLKFITKDIPIEWILQNNKNKEAYFICPVCGRKTLVVYHRKQIVICRKCIGLTRKSICRRYEFTPYSEQ